MKILLIAPQPFYEERGTPIAVRAAAEILAVEGHQVDLLTYGAGEVIDLPGVCHVRAPLTHLNSIPIGLSFKKLYCDLFLFLCMIRLCLKTRYEVLHAVEEAVFPALLLRPFTKSQVVYDMDSSMADQIVEKWPRAGFLHSFLGWWERLAIRGANFVLPVCDRLAERVREVSPEKSCVVLHDIAVEQEPDHGVDDIRADTGADEVVALYVGNLEVYQGVDMMIEALALSAQREKIQLIIIGGRCDHIERCRALVERLNLAAHVRLLGRRPYERLSQYLSQADLLVSPRTRGVNTPMKIYSYMLSGRAILATQIPSHTQVLDGKTAWLEEPTPAAMASGLDELVQNEALRTRLGRAAMDMARAHYTRHHYAKTLRNVYLMLEPSSL